MALQKLQNMTSFTDFKEFVLDLTEKTDLKGKMQVSVTTTTSWVEKSFEVPYIEQLKEKNWEIGEAITKALPGEPNPVDNLASLEINAMPPFDFRLKKIPPFILKSKQLKTLILTHHRFSRILDAELDLPNLNILNLSSCQVDTLPESLGTTCEKLTVLNLSSNLFTTLPPSIARLQNLKIFDLSGNKMDSKWIQAATCPIAELHRLTVLNLQDGGLVDVPLCVFKLGALQRLDLSKNKISRIGADIAQLKELTFLNLSGNVLKELPQEFSELKKLETCLLEANKLAQLPECLLSLIGLKALDLSSNSMSELPNSIEALVGLEELSVGSNNLDKLPSGIGSLVELTKLDVTSNAIQSIGSSIGSLTKLKSLFIDGNPKLIILPKCFASLTTLQELTVGGVRVTRDESGKLFGESSTGDKAAVAPVSGFLSPSLSPKDPAKILKKQIQQLILLGRATEHPLIIYALAVKAVDENCIDTVLEQGGLEDLVDLCLEHDQNIGKISLTAIQRMTENEAIRGKMLAHELSILSMITKVLSQPDKASEHIIAALHILAPSRAVISKSNVLSKVESLLQSNHPKLTETVRRTWAIFGRADLIGKVRKSRGIRILAVDGGGTRGVATTQMLMALEERTGRRIYEMFDLIAGTSTGSVIAVKAAVQRKSMKEILEFYRSMCGKIFGGLSAPLEKDAALQPGIFDKAQTSWAKLVGFSSFVRNGTFYQTKPYEQLVIDTCGLTTMVDSSATTDTRLIITSTRATVFPPEAYLFRNYNLPDGADSGYFGECEAMVWEAIRASSAAPSYFDELLRRGDKLIDGGIIANNPTAIAIAEAKALWPDVPIDLVLSAGTGIRPRGPVENTNQPFVVSVAVSMLESATETEKTHLALSSVLPSSQYFRLQPVHDIFKCELDEIRADKLDAMQNAAQEYMDANEARVSEILNLLGRE